MSVEEAGPLVLRLVFRRPSTSLRWAAVVHFDRGTETMTAGAQTRATTSVPEPLLERTGALTISEAESVGGHCLLVPVLAMILARRRILGRLLSAAHFCWQ